jgi:hypothetical protein
MDEDVDVAQCGQIDERRRAALADPWYVHVLHSGQGLLARLEDLRQALDALVWDARDTEPRFRPCAGRRRSGPRQQLKQSALSGRR